MDKLFLKPKEMMEQFSLTVKEVERLKKENILKLDIHYHIPEGKSYAIWNFKNMYKWATTSSKDIDVANKVLISLGL